MHWMTWNFAGVPYDNLVRNWYRFSSMHPGAIVNFSFADGSVHSINLAVDRQVLLQIAGRADGEALKVKLDD